MSYRSRVYRTTRVGKDRIVTSVDTGTWALTKLIGGSIKLFYFITIGWIVGLLKIFFHR